MFEYHCRWLAHVPRWTIAPVIRRQSVAEHSYYVALYVSQICVFLGKDHHYRLRALEYALRHDHTEIITSDIPGPTKRKVVDGEKLRTYEDQINNREGELHRRAFALAETDHSIKDIVKAADLIDELMYLASESSLGNTLINSVRQHVAERLRDALGKIDPSDTILKTVDNAMMDMHRKGVQI